MLKIVCFISSRLLRSAIEAFLLHGNVMQLAVIHQMHMTLDLQQSLVKKMESWLKEDSRQYKTLYMRIPSSSAI